MDYDAVPCTLWNLNAILLLFGTDTCHRFLPHCGTKQVRTKLPKQREQIKLVWSLPSRIGIRRSQLPDRFQETVKHEPKLPSAPFCPRSCERDTNKFSFFQT